MSPALASRFLSTVSSEKSLNTCALKILFWFVHILFFLRLLYEEMSIFLYPVLAGRILNRFSKDIGHMDDSLPLIFQDFIQVMYQSCQSSHREEQSACFSRPSHRGCCCCYCYKVPSVMSNSVQLYGLQPTRLLHPWDFPGKSTGVGCHCLLCTGTEGGLFSLVMCPVIFTKRLYLWEKGAVLIGRLS